MPAFNEIAVAQLGRLIGLPDAPAIIDVRTDEDAAADPRSIPGAARRDWRRASEWVREFAGRRAVVLCRRGLKIGQGVAAIARHEGVEAETLEGGFEAWKAAGAPLLRTDRLPRRCCGPTACPAATRRGARSGSRATAPRWTESPAPG